MPQNDIGKYINDNLQDLSSLIKELCAIPAPSHKENRRAEFCRDWLVKNGANSSCVSIDSALNTILRIDGKSDEHVIFMAHTDTVFPDLEPMPLVEKDGKMFCPGVGDDTANLAILLMMAKYVIGQKPSPNCNILFVANSCEEGLGNLKGSKQLMTDYGKTVREVISFDGYIGGIANDAVGSMRYKITVKTEGGHSFGNFGNKNAIHYLSMIIDRLYQVKVPASAKTTYNVGQIWGGTSVNTIAEEASMLYEYRSENVDCLVEMQHKFETVLDEYSAMGIDVKCELIGNRPCKKAVDSKKQMALTSFVARHIENHIGSVPTVSAGSTDCNIPLSMGIPAVCTGLCMGGGAHTRGEWIEVASLEKGFKIAADIVLDYFN